MRFLRTRLWHLQSLNCREATRKMFETPEGWKKKLQRTRFFHARLDEHQFRLSLADIVSCVSDNLHESHSVPTTKCKLLQEIPPYQLYHNHPSLTITFIHLDKNNNKSKHTINNNPKKITRSFFWSSAMRVSSWSSLSIITGI